MIILASQWPVNIFPLAAGYAVQGKYIGTVANYFHGRAAQVVTQPGVTGQHD